MGPVPSTSAAPPLGRPPASVGPAPVSVRALLERNLRWPVAAALAFRIVSAAGPLSAGVHEYGLDAMRPVLWVAGILLAANAAAILPLMGYVATWNPGVGWLVADFVAAVAVNLWSAAVLPGPVDASYHDVLWFYVLGAVMLCTGWLGPVGGLLLVLGMVPVQLIMTALSEPPPPDVNLALTVAGRTEWLFVGYFAAWMVMALSRRSGEVALQEGLRAGQQAEQARTLRAMHDTVLQTLEAVTLIARDTPAPPDERLDRIATATSDQAAELRTELNRLVRSSTGDDIVDVVAALDTVLGRFIRMSRPDQVTLVVDRPATPVRLERHRAEALELALIETLTNIAKHAQTRTVHIGLTVAAGQVHLDVRDDGRGFDRRAVTGFGIAHSIQGRLREAGGNAVVTAAPGAGTRVAMWLPAPDDERMTDSARRPAHRGNGATGD